MGILEDKKEIFGNIAALRTLNEGLPNLNRINSFSSINNGENSLSFLTDLLHSVVDTNEIKESLIDTITYKIPDIEKQIKDGIKKEIKSTVNSDTDPSLPDFLNDGDVNQITLDVKKIDTENLFLINPNSEIGKLKYGVDNLNSPNGDFKTFLFNTIQNPNTKQTWGVNTSDGGVINLEFKDVASPKNNVIKLSVSDGYDGKLTGFFNSFIDSLVLFNTSQIVTTIIDSIFGTITSNTNKTDTQLEEEINLELLLDKIINSEIDDSFFDFSNVDRVNVRNLVEERKNGKVIIPTCGDVISEVPLDDVIKLNEELKNTGDFIEIKKTITANLDNILTNSTRNIPSTDKQNVESGFIEKMFKNIISVISKIIVSPTLIFIHSIVHKVTHGASSSFDSVTDFIKNNRVFIKKILDIVRDAVLSILLGLILRKITRLIARNTQSLITDRINNQSAQLSSLVGIPQDLIRQIQNLS